MRSNNKIEKVNSNKKKQTIKKIACYTFEVVFVMFLTLLFTNIIAFFAYIPSESMCNTLQIKDRICVSRLSYIKNDPQTGDIIVFTSDQASDEGQTQLLVKRVIGTPNDVVESKDGYVYINGIQIEEDYAIKDNYSGKFVVPENSYFVMGDNREKSFDSRFWNNPFVSREEIKGKAQFVIGSRISYLY